MTVKKLSGELENFISKVNNDKGAENLEQGLKFLAENRKKLGVIELPSGLKYKILREGDREIPTAKYKIRCHYHGTLTNSTVFDNSVQRSQPAVSPVNGVIKCRVQALQLLSTGSKWNY